MRERQADPEAVVAALSTPPAARALGLDARLGDRLTLRPPSEMETITGFNFHRGVLALVRRLPVSDVRSMVAAALTDRSDGPPPILVVAEHLSDVDNVGSCFRNARAFGAACVLLDDRCPDPLYRKAVRTSLGAVLEVPWARGAMPGILEVLHAHGVATVGLTPRMAGDEWNGEGRTQDAERRTQKAGATATLAETLVALPMSPAAFVVGNEGAGLSEETLAACTRLARIPMAEGADSINVATALAVALYEYQTSRGGYR